MHNLKLFIKGFFVGMGGVSPGLSGAIIMVVFGLYRKVIDSFATINKDTKNKILFLLPIMGGMLSGVVIFSRFISHLLVTYEFYTRLTFFGLLLGAIPLVYGEVKKNGDVKRKHHIISAVTFLVFFSIFTFGVSIPTPGELNFIGSFLFGALAITATIVPGIEAASFLSTFGLYGHWLDFTSLRNVTAAHYIPTLMGVAVGGISLSKLMSYLFNKDYTTTFAVLFGFFLSIIPNVLNTTYGGFVSLNDSYRAYLGIILLFIGVFVALVFGRIMRHFEKANERNN